MKIYLRLNDSNTGPFDEGEVRRQLAAGHLAPDVYAWQEGQPDWKPLRDLLPAAPSAVPLTPAFAAPGQPPRAQMPWWAKTLLGLGGIFAVAGFALVALIIASIVSSSLPRSRSASSAKSGEADFPARNGDLEAQMKKQFADEADEVKRAIADTEHNTVTRSTDAAGRAVVTVTPKADGGNVIVQTTDANGNVSTSINRKPPASAPPSAETQTTDSHGNVSTRAVPRPPASAPPSAEAQATDSPAIIATPFVPWATVPEPHLEKRPAEEFRDDRRAAEGGDAAAQARLGERFLFGQGVDRDDTQALKWFRLSAAAGDARGQARMGDMYMRAAGLPRDEKEAVLWYKKAVAQGDPCGQEGLGGEYQLGRGGLPRDTRQAVALYRQSAEQGWPDGEIALGISYEEGMGGLKKDLAQARLWFQKAADAGDGMGQKYLADLDGRN